MGSAGNGVQPRRADRLHRMFTIGRNFHVIHMTEDMATLDAWYDDVFSVNRWIADNYNPDLHRYASLVGIGDLCIEPMQPAFEDDGWNKAPIGRYYERAGTSWHSIAWYVDDIEGLTELRDALEAAGVELLALLGGKLEHDPDAPEDRPIFTHPDSTVTQLEFMVPTSMLYDPRLHVSYPRRGGTTRTRSTSARRHTSRWRRATSNVHATSTST